MARSDPSKLDPHFGSPLSAARSTPAGSLLAFFLLTYALIWTCFISVAAVGIPAHSPLGALLLYLGTFAPSLAALWLTVRAEGSTGVRALLGRVLRWRVAAQWYVFAVSYIAAIKLTVALIHRLATGAWPRFGNEAWYIIVVAIAFSTPFQAGEEIGWRGYALPRLAARFGLARASILLGLCPRRRIAMHSNRKGVDLFSTVPLALGHPFAAEFAYPAPNPVGTPTPGRSCRKNEPTSCFGTMYDARHDP